ncbi:MAG TPA: YlxR family protein [Aeromicrobium sp.]|nr:YlxR family protein [Aeromicrobium sp.]
MATVVRTCIGCRERADKTTLVRLVAVRQDSTSVVVPDLRGSLPGRGAHLHPTIRCLELATTRKAFGRALRLDGPYDLSAVRSLVAADHE